MFTFLFMLVIKRFHGINQSYDRILGRKASCEGALPIRVLRKGQGGVSAAADGRCRHPHPHRRRRCALFPGCL